MRTKALGAGILLQAAIVSLSFFADGCGVLAPGDRYEYEKVYVSGVTARDTISAGESLCVRVLGGLPNTAWTFDHFENQIKGRSIRITPIGKHEPHMPGYDVIVPFDETTVIEGLQIGTYQINVIGRFEILVDSLVVIPGLFPSKQDVLLTSSNRVLDNFPP